MKCLFFKVIFLGLFCELVNAQDVLSGLRTQSEGFAKVVPDVQLKFPEDHGAHEDFRIEWWYLTSNLKDDLGQDWGVHWTLFRQALSPDHLSASSAPWQSSQIWMAHAAITTPQGHFHEQRFARGGIGQAGVKDSKQDGNFEAWLDDWLWQSESKRLFPAKLNFSIGQRKLQLHLQAKEDIVKNGIDGYSQKSAQGQASYYYSEPQIKVLATLLFADNRISLSGVGWLDREWSSQPLAKNQKGWDWFSLHLYDGRKLMLYRLRHDNGDNWTSGTLVASDGSVTALSKDDIKLEVTQIREVEITSNTIKSLPMQWKIKLSGEQAWLNIKPLYDEQWMDTSIPYWEGVILVQDDRGQNRGRGYMELTGY